jgi:hypothetical protein
MYEYPWGISRKAKLSEFVEEVEKKRGIPFEYDDSGRLVLVEDADRIIGAIVMTSRVFQLRRRQEFYGD